MLDLVTAATGTPVDLADLKDQIRGLDKSTGDDGFVRGLNVSVTALVETYLNRVLMPQTWDYYRDAVPSSSVLEIPNAPLSSITSITTIDANEVSTVFASSNYVVDTVSSPGRVALKTGIVWPSTTLKVVNGFVVRFVAGYANKAAIPQAIKTAIVRAVDALYSNRKTKQTNQKGQNTQPARLALPSDAKELLLPYKVFQV